MPHISVKMLKGRTPEQKKKVAEACQKAAMASLGIGETYVTVSVEDFTAQEWQDVFKEEVTDKGDSVLVKAKYDPKSLL
ncbi:MAG: 4-oxalocrotonate tautomerase family protein [Oscillospiraceae bacterium]|jgi:phenylpyruvate tautomerase PptA (4-oxalocrotonate tautomerase family)|nr:4-oxalocrotonate tautomerase family protein [Oscillospiraceae bacterium]